MLSDAVSVSMTVAYPYELSVSPTMLRGLHSVVVHRWGVCACIWCKLCHASCPSSSLFYTCVDHGDFRLPLNFVVNYGRCIYCGLCGTVMVLLGVELYTSISLDDIVVKNL